MLLNPFQDYFGNFCFSHYMAGGTHFVYRSAVFNLFIFILLYCTIYSSPKLPFKRVDLGLESLAVYRSAAASINLQSNQVEIEYYVRSAWLESTSFAQDF